MLLLPKIYVYIIRLTDFHSILPAFEPLKHQIALRGFAVLKSNKSSIYLFPLLSDSQASLIYIAFRALCKELQRFFMLGSTGTSRSTHWVPMGTPPGETPRRSLDGRATQNRSRSGLGLIGGFYHLQLSHCIKGQI